MQKTFNVLVLNYLALIVNLLFQILEILLYQYNLPDRIRESVINHGEANMQILKHGKDFIDTVFADKG